MADLDVSLRLRLVNQLSRPAEEAERDLKELKEAAERLGKVKGGDQLAGDLDKLQRRAGAAKTSLDDIGRTARQLGSSGNGLDALARGADKAATEVRDIGAAAAEVKTKLGQIDNGAGLDVLKADAEKVSGAVRGIGAEADETKRKLGTVDADALRKMWGDVDKAKQGVADIGAAATEARTKLGQIDDGGALDNLKTDADQAAKAVREIGAAADKSQTQLNQMQGANQRFGSRAGGMPPPGEDRRRVTGNMVEGLADRAGVDAIVPIGAGVAYATGAAAGAGVTYAGLAYKHFAGNERENQYIWMNMGVPAEEVPQRNKQLRDIARDTRTPYNKVQEGLAALAANGLPIDEIMTMLPAVARTSLASDSEPADVANAAVAARDKMKIAPQDMQLAFDKMVLGGNLGQFEFKDMSAHLPTVLAYASQAGLTGFPGLDKVIAMLQATRADTGDPSSAATNLQNVFAKMRSEETERNFKDYGVNLPAEYKKGRAAGKDDVQILYDAAMKASNGGDPDILARLFVDQQSFMGLQSLVRKAEKIKADEATLATEAPGTVDRQYNRVGHDAQSSIDAVSNAADRATVSIGRIVDRLGLSSALDFVARRLDAGSERPQDTLEAIGSFTGPTQFMLDLVKRQLGGSDLSKPIVVPTGDWRAPAYEPPRTRGGVSDVRPMPSGPIAGAIIGQVESELSTDMSEAARQSMDGYNQELAAQTDRAVVVVQSAVQELKAMLSFTASPVISPVVNRPAVSGGSATPAVPATPAAPTGEQHSSVQPAGYTSTSQVQLTQNITSTNPRTAARTAQREQNRAVRLAQSNALHDLGSRV